MSATRAGYAWVAPFDLLVCLLLIFLVLALTAQPTTPTPPTIDTLGVYAVTTAWGDGSNDDVDLYLADPADNISYFGAMDVGLMHLEVDDLGTRASGTFDNAGKRVVVLPNHERIVIRGAVPGEYVVNVQMYGKADPKPTPVVVTLWRLRGNDVEVTTRTVTLRADGDHQTAFRFTLDAKGNVSNINTLDKDIVTPTVTG